MIGDLARFIGQPDHLLEDAIVAAGYDSMFTLPEEFDTTASGYFVPAKLGLEAAIGHDAKIERIFLHSENHHDFAQYPFHLPEGLQFGMTREDARKLLGPPDQISEPSECVVHKRIVCGDRWNRPRYSLHCEYPESGDRILMVTISRIP